MANSSDISLYTRVYAFSGQSSTLRQSTAGAISIQVHRSHTVTDSASPSAVQVRRSPTNFHVSTTGVQSWSRLFRLASSRCFLRVQENLQFRCMGKVPVGNGLIDSQASWRPIPCDEKWTRRVPARYAGRRMKGSIPLFGRLSQ